MIGQNRISRIKKIEKIYGRLWVFIILIKAGDKIFAFFVAVATVGFFSLAVTALGLVDLEMVAAVCLTTFGCWLIYSGCTILMENVLVKKIIPY